MVDKNYGIPDSFGEGGANLQNGYGEPSLRDVLRDARHAIWKPLADTAALQATQEDERDDGQLVVKIDDLSVWIYSAASAASSGAEVIVPTDAGSTGRFLRVTGPAAGASPNIQSGTGTLVAGILAITGLAITASSQIILTRRAPAGTMGVEWDTSTRTVAAGTGGAFTAKSVKTDKTVETADTSTFDYLVIG